MRLVFISNLYPPQFVGGYELACHDLVEALTARGHEIDVVTAAGTAPADEAGVARVLRRTPRAASGTLAVPRLIHSEWFDRRVVRKRLREVKPDVALFWNLASIPLSLLAVAACERCATACYVFDDRWSRADVDDAWTSWRSARSDGTLKRLFRRIAVAALDGAGPVAPVARNPIDTVIYASEFLHGLSLPPWPTPARSLVIPWGVDSHRFPYAERQPGEPVRLLYVGQIVPHKGVHTAIEAVARLVGEGLGSRLTLSIVGGSVVPEYGEHLRALVREHQLEETVRFAGQVEPPEVPALMAGHDILLFPSLWDEPFGITQVEAMAAGAVVVGTATGGAGEVLQDERNGLAFPPGDVDACARQVGRLLADASLCERLRRAARADVAARFPFARTVDAIEACLEALTHRENMEARRDT